MRVEEWVARRAVEAYRQPPRRAARIALADTIMVASAAPSLSETARKVAEILSRSGGGSLVLGLWRKTGPLEAAAANALLAHSIEYDDWLAYGYVHAGSVVLPAILAVIPDASVGEAERLLAAGYEAAARAGSYLGRSHYRVWHSTATAGSIAAAVVAALAGGGRVEEVEAAVSLAAVYMGGLWTVNKGTGVYKPMSPAAAAVTGLKAAWAALSVGEKVPDGLSEACSALQGECTIKDTVKRGVELNGIKLYPTCRHSHTSIEAAERLHPQVSHRRIERVLVEVFGEAARVAGKRNPKTPEEARFSIPYLVAVALTYGKVGFSELNTGLGDDNVRELASRVELLVNNDYTRMYPSKQPATVRVYCSDGSWCEETVETPRGDPSRPPTRRDLEWKASTLDPYTHGSSTRILLALLDARPDDSLEDIILSTINNNIR